jgi:hypothetical protein
MVEAYRYFLINRKNNTHIFNGAEVETTPSVRPFKGHTSHRLKVVDTASFTRSHGQSMKCRFLSSIRSIVDVIELLLSKNANGIKVNRPMHTNPQILPQIRNPRNSNRPLTGSLSELVDPSCQLGIVSLVGASRERQQVSRRRRCSSAAMATSKSSLARLGESELVNSTRSVHKKRPSGGPHCAVNGRQRRSDAHRLCCAT